jgi:KDO2-lipid IV(A) lauroyltransferase
MPLIFLSPQYWPTWFGMLLLWLIAKLPWKILMFFGHFLGRLLYWFLKRRRHICDTNLRLAFPDLLDEERKTLVREHFISLGKGLLETAISWWGSETKLQSLSHFEGLEHLLEHLGKDKEESTGIILLSAHFTSLELGGRILSASTPLHVLYRPHQNNLIEWLVARARRKRYGKAIPRDNIRAMIKSLKNKQLVWYAQDQNFGHKNSVFAPFFGVEAATNTGTSRISKISNAVVIPFFTFRCEDRNEKAGYLLRFLPALKDFPSDNPQSDAIRINRIIEDQVREFSDQYLWTHRRYKDHPEGKNRY